MRREKRVPVRIALALTRLECWSQLDHDQRRFAYETVSAMQRLRVPPQQYEQFMDWLDRAPVPGRSAGVQG